MSRWGDATARRGARCASWVRTTTLLWPGSTRLLLCAAGLWAVALVAPGPGALLLTPVLAAAGFVCLRAHHHLGVGLILFACLVTVEITMLASARGPSGHEEMSGTVVGHSRPGAAGWTRLTVVTGTGFAEVLAPSALRDGSAVTMTTQRLGDIRVSRQEPRIIREPGPLWQWRNDLRAGLREDAVAAGHAGGRLLPGLVIGDTEPQDARMLDDMRVVSLTHVSAVSGTNVSIVALGAGILAGACRAGPRTRVGVGVLTCLFYLFIVGFEPSAIRAAAMATAVAIVFLRGGGISPVAVICTCVCVLLAFVPVLASSLGFVLSVVSTAAIMFVIPVLVRALTVRLPLVPAVVIGALVVPLVAQVACTPVLVAIDPRVGLWSVLANAVAAPAILPATILGFVSLVSGGLGLLGVPGLLWGAEVCAWFGSLFAWWIAAVARVGAGLPGASLDWPAPPWGTVIALALLLVLSVGVWLLLRWKQWGLPVVAACLALTALIVIAQRSRPPAADWAVMICDVGQGSATVVNLGQGRGLVVDTGEEPKPIDECLDSSGVDDVELFISHFDADHSAGWEATMWSRSVEKLWVSPNAVGPESERIVASSRAELLTAERGQQVRIGPAAIDVLWPIAANPPPGAAGSLAAGTAAGGAESGAAAMRPRQESAERNRDSLVLRVELAGLSILLPGDIGEDEQFLVAQGIEPVDVLVAPHHGSSDLSEDFYSAAAARLGAVSVGENRYGHPSPRSLRAFGPVPVLRTDRCGTIALYPDARYSTDRSCS